MLGISIKGLMEFAARIEKIRGHPVDLMLKSCLMAERMNHLELVYKCFVAAKRETTA